MGEKGQEGVNPCLGSGKSEFVSLVSPDRCANGSEFDNLDISPQEKKTRKCVLRTVSAASKNASKAAALRNRSFLGSFWQRFGRNAV